MKIKVKKKLPVGLQTCLNQIMLACCNKRYKIAPSAKFYYCKM